MGRNYDFIDFTKFTTFFHQDFLTSGGATGFDGVTESETPRVVGDLTDFVGSGETVLSGMI